MLEARERGEARVRRANLIEDAREHAWSCQLLHYDDELFGEAIARQVEDGWMREDGTGDDRVYRVVSATAAARNKRKRERR